MEGGGTMSIWLPDYTVDTRSGKTGSVPRKPDAPSRIILHTTETRSLPNYPWPPHFTVGVVHPESLSTYYGSPGTARRWQHCDLELTSYALKSSPRVETNHMGRECVQIEIITYSSKNKGAWPDALTDVVAHTLADIITALPHLAPALSHMPSKWSRYPTTATRMTPAQWTDPFDGQPFIAGHEHVPDNDHWDPGAPVDGNGNLFQLILRARQILGGLPLPIERDDEMREGDSGPSVKALQGRLNLRGAHLLVDGEYGPKTAKAVANAQRAMDLTETGAADSITVTLLWNSRKPLPL